MERPAPRLDGRPYQTGVQVAACHGVCGAGGSRVMTPTQAGAKGHPGMPGMDAPGLQGVSTKVPWVIVISWHGCRISETAAPACVDAPK